MPSVPRRALALTAALTAVLTLAGCQLPGTAHVSRLAAPPAIERDCPAGSSFRCVTLAVPADHDAPGTSPTWHVTFAVHRATGPSRGVLVTATGGPGSSGIALADAYTAAMDPAITEHYDLVFFDQRGVGVSHPFRCDDALDSWYPSTQLDASSSTADRDRFARQDARFARHCLAEAGVAPGDAPLFGTRQAVEDLEVFRRWDGADRLTLYGESYGSEYVQAYAAAHPTHVAGLVLDGVVDPATDLLTFARETAASYDAALVAALAGCDADPVCAADAPGTSLAGYDQLAAELRRAPRSFRYPRGDGRTERRRLTAGELSATASGAVSDPTGREELQRALNAAQTGDEVPLERLAAAVQGVDPDTGAGVPDPTFSEAALLAVRCADHPRLPSGGTARAQLDAWLAAARADDADDRRTSSGFYSDLDCTFWPGSTTPEPPAVLPPDPPFPVLALTADVDPNTPTQQADRVVQRSAGRTRLLVRTGGAHVVYGRGEPCVDDAVTALVTTGTLPAAPTTTCPGPVADPYSPVPPTTAAGWRTGDQAAEIVTGAVLDDPAYVAWSGERPLTLGCAHGGTVRYRVDAAGAVQVQLRHCAWTAGVPVDGTVRVPDGGSGLATLDVTLPFGSLTGPRGAVSGELRGVPFG